MAKLADIENEIRRVWRKRYDGKKSGHDVLVFYNELCQDRPDLLGFRCSGDKYQKFHTILSGLVKGDLQQR